MNRQAAKALAIMVPLLAAAVLLGWQLTKPAAPAPARSGVCLARCHYVGALLTVVGQHPVSEFKQITRLTPGIVENYQAFGQPFPSSWAGTLLAQGILPLIQLNPRLVTLGDIAAGRYDRYLSHYAAAARALGAPIGLSFGNEMNASWNPWGYRHVPPAVFVAAWRHIHQVFAAVGARKVIWVWTVARIRHTPGDRAVAPGPRPWWPGGAYVNWVGLDIYYVSPKVTFQGEFVPTITAVRSFTDDPILLTGTAVPDQSGQVRQITDLFAGARASHLLGIIWANQNGRRTWQLNKSRRAAVAAFRRGAASMLASR
jgi:mannan endo-1,4-beta-mannosidase